VSDVHEQQVKNLKIAVNKHCNLSGADLCKEIEKASMPVIEWLAYLRSSEATGIADILLTGIHSTVIEAAGCLCLGLARSALFGMRAEIDMLLAWLYFKDHPIEWEYVQSTGEGYKLKQELIRHLEFYVPKYKERFGLLQQCKKRTELEPYKLLSAHIHSQSVHCVPSIGALSSLVSPLSDCNQCIQIQKEVTEYLNDVLFSCYADKWASLPKSIVSDTTSRLTGKQKKVFFSL